MSLSWSPGIKWNDIILAILEISIMQPWTKNNGDSSLSKIILKIFFPKFLCFLGCIHFIYCFDGVSDESDWWSNKVRLISVIFSKFWKITSFTNTENHPVWGCSFLSQWSDLTSQIWWYNAGNQYTDMDPHSDNVDHFHEIWQMQDIWNYHMVQEYDPSWIICLDKSAIKWHNSWMCIPWKPHPFGNEYHLINDIDDGSPIMWRLELQNGKDWPSAIGAKKHDEKGKTVGLMIWWVSLKKFQINV